MSQGIHSVKPSQADSGKRESVIKSRIVSSPLLMLALVISTLVLGLSTSCATTGKIASVKTMYVSNFSFEGYEYALKAELKPTSSAQPNTDYVVELYEKNQLRATTTVSWNQLELNVLESKWVEFPASKAEYDTYLMEDISHIFTVKVHE